LIENYLGLLTVGSLHIHYALFQFTQVNRQRLTNLAQWVDQNNIKVNVDKTFSLDEASKALDYQKDVHPRGKVVLTV
jgi:alcohol dehydrogenase